MRQGQGHWKQITGQIQRPLSRVSLSELWSFDLGSRRTDWREARKGEDSRPSAQHSLYEPQTTMQPSAAPDHVMTRYAWGKCTRGSVAVPPHQHMGSVTSLGRGQCPWGGVEASVAWCHMSPLPLHHHTRVVVSWRFRVVRWSTPMLLWGKRMRVAIHGVCPVHPAPSMESAIVPYITHEDAAEVTELESEIALPSGRLGGSGTDVSSRRAGRVGIGGSDGRC